MDRGGVEDVPAAGAVVTGPDAVIDEPCDAVLIGKLGNVDPSIEEALRLAEARRPQILGVHGNDEAAWQLGHHPQHAAEEVGDQRGAVADSLDVQPRIGVVDHEEDVGGNR